MGPETVASGDCGAGPRGLEAGCLLSQDAVGLPRVTEVQKRCIGVWPEAASAETSGYDAQGLWVTVVYS